MERRGLIAFGLGFLLGGLGFWTERIVYHVIIFALATTLWGWLPALGLAVVLLILISGFFWCKKDGA